MYSDVELVILSVNTFAYCLFFLDLFINLPMNGVYTLPGNWTKGSTITYGGLAAFVLAFFVADKYPLPWYVAALYIYLNIYTSHLHLMNFIPKSWSTGPQIVVTEITDPKAIDKLMSTYVNC